MFLLYICPNLKTTVAIALAIKIGLAFTHIALAAGRGHKVDRVAQGLFAQMICP
jgi:hypothetical protein